MVYKLLSFQFFTAFLIFAQSSVSAGPGDWPSYDGSLTGNRHSELAQITKTNIGGLKLSWSLPISNPGDLEVTPVVIGGVMYATGVNQVLALNAANGKQLWHYSRPQSTGLIDDAASGINRGVAVSDQYVIFATDNAHLVALNKQTGKIAWETVMADSTQNYGATGAPLVVGNVVIMGHSGGDDGVRGFLAGYDIQTGKRKWTFWTVPEPSEPAAATWKSDTDLPHGGGATWMTGTYDSANDILYWTTGNPGPDYDGDKRLGSNLYTDSVLALRPETGQLLWYYQFTPHDLFDFDAQQTPMLVDAEFNGKQRSLLLQSSRNGFFYVLDRLTGEFLRATPFVTNLTWATSTSGSPPVPVPAETPSVAGTTVCPSTGGGTTWMSNAFDTSSKFFFLMSNESCAAYFKSPTVFIPGQGDYGGTSVTAFFEKHVRAIDLKTGKIAWDKSLVGPGQTNSGVLSTAGGLVFFGDDNGNFTAVDSATGNQAWTYVTTQAWHASPMTYAVNNKQYVAIAAPTQLMVFALD